MTSDRPLDHEAARELLPAYALGALTPEDTDALQELLADWPEGQRELRDLIETTSTFSMLAPEATPPLGLESRIVAAARSERGEAGPVRRRKPSPLWRRLIPHTLAAGFAAAAIVLGLLLVTEDEPPLQGVWTDVVGVSADLEFDAVRAYIVRPGTQPTAVFFSQLQPAPNGDAYHLWLLLEDESVTSLDGFSSTGPDDRPAVWLGHRDEIIVGYAVTRESDATNDTPPLRESVLFTVPSS
jgi:hypothetical protein